jgi:hypothetical protein
MFNFKRNIERIDKAAIVAAFATVVLIWMFLIILTIVD